MHILSTNPDLNPITVAPALLANSKAYRIELETLFMIMDKTPEYIKSKNNTINDTPPTQNDTDKEIDDLLEQIRKEAEEEEEKKRKSSYNN